MDPKTSPKEVIVEVIVEKIVYVDRPVEVEKIVYVNCEEEDWYWNDEDNEA